MTRCVRCLLFASSFGLFISGAAISQQPGSQPAPSSTTPVATLHTGTKLVVVDVVVRDKNGHAVHGLTRDDFKLEEGGKPQTLRSFDEHITPPGPATPIQMPKLPPGMFTDFTPVRATGPLNVLLIDALNTPLMDQSSLRAQLVEFAAHLQPGTRVAIFGLSNHLYLLQGFTSDTRNLSEILGSLKTGRQSTLLANSSTNNSALLDSMTDPSGGAANMASSTSGGGSALMSNNVETFLNSIAAMQLNLRVQMTIEAFNTLGHWLVNFPGRKNVIWFSGAFPLGFDPTADPQNNMDLPGEDSDEFRLMTNLLTRAEASVYPVDPRGVQTNSAFSMEDTSPNQTAQFRTNSRNFYANEAAEHSTMQAIASDTGGEPFYNRNNLVKATGDAMEAGANYYSLAYTPSENKSGGEWRGIKIQLTSPDKVKGVQLSYRRGYFADNLRVPGEHTGSAEVAADPATPEHGSYSRLAMMHGAPEIQDIPFTVRILPASTSTETLVAAGNVLDPKTPIKPPYRRFDVDCAAASRYFTLLHRPDGHYVGAVQTAIFAYNADGKLVNAASRTLKMDLTPEAYADFQRLGFREHMEISVPAKSESFLRVGIEERTSGRIGTVEVATSTVSMLPPPDYASQAKSQNPPSNNPSPR